MKTIRQFTALAVSLALTSTAFAGIGADKAAYMGGTIAGKTGQEGVLDFTGKENAVFRVKKANEISIPYSTVTSIEYGQKAGRRICMAAATTILVTPVGLLALLSKKRNHMVTIGWTVDGRDEAAVFEVRKDAIRQTLASLAARTGKKVEYESEDAKKNIGK